MKIKAKFDIQKTQRSVFLLDARNHGKSSHSDDMTYLHMASDLKKFCADKNISKATIVGNFSLKVSKYRPIT
jgi:hypothetical protein